MSFQVDLPQEMEDELTAEAAQLGLPLSEYVMRVLSARSTTSSPLSGADLVSYWESEGLIGSRDDITDSQQHSRQLRKRAEHRERY